MPSLGHLDKTSHLFVHLTRPTPNSGPLRNLFPRISSYPQKLRPGGTLYFGTKKSKDRNLDRVPDRARFRSTLQKPWHTNPTLRYRGFSGSCYATSPHLTAASSCACGVLSGSPSIFTSKDHHLLLLLLLSGSPLIFTGQDTTTSRFS